MEQILAALFAELLKYGAPGVAIGYLIVMILRRERTIEDKDAQIKDLMEKRVSEAIIAANTTNALAASNEKIVEALDRLDDTMKDFGRILERVDRRTGPPK
jgi:hypothetical protein